MSPENNSSDERIKSLEEKVAQLEAAVNYAVYGIGSPQPDPRDKPAE